MTEEQFKTLYGLLENILGRLESINEDVSSLSECVETRLESIRVYPVTYAVRNDD